MNLRCSLLCLCFAGLGDAPMAQTPARQGSTASDYVFIVDTSFSMARQKQAVVETVSTLITSGIHGAMRPGDTLALWTFNDRVHTNRFPAEPWASELSQHFAARAAHVLRLQRFEKQTQLDKAVIEALKTSRDSRNLVILLVSDGDSSISGTPFDRSLNLLYQEHGRRLRKARRPFVTTLVARENRILAWAVKASGEIVQIPEIPRPFRMPQTASASAPATNNLVVLKTPAPLEVKETSEPKPPAVSTPQTTAVLPLPAANPPPPTSTPIPEKITENIEPQKPPLNVLLTAPETNSPAPPLSPNPSAKNLETKAPSPPPNAGAREPEMATIPNPTIPQLDLGQTLSTTNALAALPTPDPKEEAAPSPGSQGTASLSPVAQTALAVPPEQGSKPNRFLLAGLALLLAALGFFYWYVRSSRPHHESSLISQSLEREDK